ncbi:Gfo/Idh/MocA family protein [Paenibacillus thailandensis]|uniref:Gfo/Idh/MocA family protein n=1 Tax=Paenibacillus thailandensis TaxID=393250 RepID=A0ABW5QWE3_9BACL
MTKSIKWGILGTGGIAEKFTSDLAYATYGEAAAVGSRTLESAKRFADKFGIPQAHGSYEELANDPDIDAIYIATPHPFHKENVLTCLKAGKAVLCEKPFTINSGDLEELTSYAKENGLFLMEGMWTRFLPAVIRAKEWIRDGRIGEVLHVKADFGFRTTGNPEGRMLNPALGGGALLDVGIYVVSFASMIFGAEPEKVISTAHIGETGVDEQNSIILEYGSGKTAALSSAIRVELANEAYIFGTEGYIHLPSFFNAKTVTLLRHGQVVDQYKDERKSLGYNFEADEVARCLNNGRTESGGIPLDESLAIMKLMDAVRQQWGLRYPMEN